MADRSIVVRLRADVADFKRKMGEASKSTEDAISRNRESADQLFTTVGVVGAALVAGAGAAVARFAEFDKQMSAVQAATRTTGAELDSLREAAIRAGAETSYSAAEAAAGIENLAKAGISTADILGGGLDGALSLAAAGGIEVADAAEIAATALTQFNLKGRDVTHVADLLAAGAGKAQGNVGDLSQALNQSGLIASQTGLSIEETTGALAAFASAGLLGSDAGTSFKTMLQVLAAPSTTAAAEMERLGISAYDASGQFVGLEALAGNLRVALEDLTPQQRTSALATIFGSDAVRAASVIYSQGADGIREWTAAVDDQGFAAETARIQTDNLVGDLERLGGAFDSVLIQSGSGANDSLRELVQGAEAVVEAIGQIPGPVLSATTLIAGAGGLALLGVAGMGKLVVGVNDARVAVQALGISARTAGLAVGGIGAALAVGTIALASWAQNAAEAKARTDALQGTLDEFGRTTDGTLSAINDMLSANQNNFLDDLFGRDAESLIDRAERLGVAVEDLQGYILGNEDAIRSVTEATEGYISAQDRELNAVDVRAQAGRFLLDQLDAESQSLTDAQKAAGQKQIADEAAGVATDGLTESTIGATTALAQQTSALEEAVDAQLTAAGVILGLRDAQRAHEAALDAAAEALTENGATLDITTEKGRANSEALDEIVASGLRVVDTMRENGATQEELQAAMQDTRDEVIATATSFGMSADEANRFADELGLIPRDVGVDVHASIDGAQAKIDRFIRDNQGRTIGIQVTAPVGASPGLRAFASGGHVVGPGTGTSDSIHALLSNGEHVLTASDVAKAGGHEAIYQLRSAIQSGALKFAQGGEVARARYATGGEVSAYTVPRFAVGGPVAPSVSVSASVGDVVARMDRRDLEFLGDYIVSAQRTAATSTLAAEAARLRYRR